MTVIIHDFEVIAEPPPAAAGEAAGAEGDAAAAAASAAPGSSGPTPTDVRFVIETHRRRCLRLWAH